MSSIKGVMNFYSRDASVEFRRHLPHATSNVYRYSLTTQAKSK